MSLEERLAAPPTATGRICAVRELLDSITSANEKAALIRALENKAWGHSALTRELKEEGYDISLRQIERHRRGECKCPQR